MASALIPGIHTEEGQEVLVHQLFERAPPAIIMMRVTRTRRVEADCVLTFLHGGHFVGVHEHNLPRGSMNRRISHAVAVRFT